MKNQNHTHEVWMNKKSLDADTVSVFKGDYTACYKYVDTIAKKQGCGAGLLLGNGNYDIVSLAMEAKYTLEKSAPELLEALKLLNQAIHNEMLNHRLSFENQNAIQAIKKATTLETVKEKVEA